ncbi:hypothetical protein RO3G_05453 [Rhizopus delemar RA 99-880]|uniref:Uncharacterized protein n=1 Tax=Rhizopus delemar (strain RA 99-880 / ATCC MYA-4621 / FGSC 9543 / NRRL 43880) TaxID=246409 RepID=I1BX18_RHIO9|nr:hypothetical protein RO3G_05453 [Rhizopus delemar RA 99-880]|eukprot:EIE80748.1 hypothetical protein RO3G_05453 [Rhizopus delemar RA 99-880]
MNRGIEQYEQSPPAYEAESTRPFLEADEQFVAGEDMYKETVANSTLEIRMQFVRKVYSILTVQILGTALVSALYMSTASIKTWVQNNHMVGTIVTYYDKSVALQALIITFGVFLALTLFTLQSKWDFSGMAPILFAGIWVLLIGGFLVPFSSGMELPLAAGGVVIFSGYIIFDTYLIFNRYSPEDYIMASTSLYLDMINLFLRILQILNGTSRD